MKRLLILLASFILGFGIWYLIFWFFTNEPHPFQWHWGVKIIYFFVSHAATEGIAKGVLNR